jgi:hypothetical protein
VRENAHTLSDFRVPTLSIECEPCGRRGRYNVAKLISKYGDASSALATAPGESYSDVILRLAAVG